MVVDQHRFDKMKNEQIRLISKKLVEGISRREQQRLDRVVAELKEMEVMEASCDTLEYF